MLPALLIAVFLLGSFSSGCFEMPRFPDEPADPAQPMPGVDASAPAEPLPQEQVARPALRIGAWNVRRLGVEGETDTVLLARLIERHFDVLALVEVMQTEGGGHAGLDELLESLGPSWNVQATASARPNLRSPFAEFYAILFRTGTLAPCNDSPYLEFHPDGDGSEANGPDHFLREPAFGCYQQTSSGTERGFDFLLGVYHARWGTGSADEIASEVVHVNDVVERQAALHPAEKDLFLLGDFNLGAVELGRVVKAEDATEGSGSTLNHSGERSANLLDHLLVVNPEYTHELIGAAEVLDLRSEAGSDALYVERVSDHLPIRALFRSDGSDDDG